jgi:hypothetical protein
MRSYCMPAGGVYQGERSSLVCRAGSTRHPLTSASPRGAYDSSERASGSLTTGWPSSLNKKPRSHPTGRRAQLPCKTRAWGRILQREEVGLGCHRGILPAAKPSRQQGTAHQLGDGWLIYCVQKDVKLVHRLTRATRERAVRHARLRAPLHKPIVSGPNLLCSSPNQWARGHLLLRVLAAMLAEGGGAKKSLSRLDL